MAAVKDRELLLVGIRPEYFEDASLVDEAKRPLGSMFRAQVDVTEWLGDSQYAYIPYEAPEADHRTSCASCPASWTPRSCAPRPIVSIDSTSRIREGHEAEFWLDTRKIHVFDPQIRGQPDPRRRGRRRADPAGDARTGSSRWRSQARAGDLGRRRLSARSGTPASWHRSRAWWRTPSSTRSTCAASPTPTATASATSAGIARAAAVPRRPRRRRGLDHAVLPVADGRRRATTSRDYCDIDPRFGTLADADALLARAHALGLRVIVDLVANHTSERAPVVPAALAAGPVARSGRGTSSATAAASAGSRRRTTGSAPSAARRGRG